MNPTELRIGNFVSDIHASDSFFAKVRKIECSRCYYGGYHSAYSDLKPIPLNEEWLLKLGFKPFSKDWSKSVIIIHTRKRGYVLRKSVPTIKYVHQLQNLFFALTGEELELKKSQ